MSDIRKKFGRRLVELRKTQNFNQERFAEAIDISPRNLSNIENGYTFPTPERIEKIAQVLNCPIKSLFDFEHHKNNPDILSEINKYAKSADRNRLQDIYKVVKALLEI